MGPPMAYHVLVAFSYASLATVALRDNNRDAGTTFLGVGTAGQLWHIASDWLSDLSSYAASDQHISSSQVNGSHSSSEEFGGEVEVLSAQPDMVMHMPMPPWMLHDENDQADYMWDYNPFRIYARGEGNHMTHDNACPHVNSFASQIMELKKPIRHMCFLRYLMLNYCNLPHEVCTSCSCEVGEEEDPGHYHHCVTLECFRKLPWLWTKAFLIISVIIVAVHVVAAPIFEFVLKYVNMIPMARRFLVQFIGTSEKAPARPHFRIYLLVIQIIASVITVIVFCMMNMAESSQLPWNLREEGHFVSTIAAWMQFVFNVQMMVNYYVTWLKNGFHWSAVLSANMLIDVATVHRTLIRQIMYSPSQPPLGKGLEWVDIETQFLAFARPMMNFHFLRGYRCLSALLEIQDMGAMNRFGGITKQMIKSSLRLFALVITVSGLTVLCEWVGHDQSLHMDSTMDIGECKNQSDLADNIACMPFLVGIYWVFTTISTVGYGDFAPHSAISYLLVIVIIVGGVTFFSLESNTLIEVMSLQNHGLAPCLASQGHVVVSGGAMRDVDECVMNHFIHQLLHKAVTEQGREWPFCCLLGKASADDVVKFLDQNCSNEMKKHIQFCNADPLKPEGLDLAKVEAASIVYILPSSASTDYSREDEYNIHVALSIKNCNKVAKAAPVPFRLVLFKPSSLELAITNGIHPGQCVCLDQLRTAIMAQASEVRGWPCLLMGLTNNAIYDPARFDDYCKQSLFPEDYGSTCENCLFGFALHKTVGGKPFYELAQILYQETGALLVGAQLGGIVQHFPWETIIDPDTIVFAIHNKDLQTGPKSSKFCSQVDWRQMFTQRRANWFAQRSWTKEQGAALERYIKAPPATLTEEKLSEEGQEEHRLKAEAIKNSGENFLLVIMTAVENYWQLLCMYIEKLPITGREPDSKLDGFSCIAFVHEPPPQNVVEHLKADDPNLRLAFFVGNWMEPENLQVAGAEQAKVIVTFEVNSLLAKPDNDTRTFFLLRLIARMQLRPECCVMSELSSGLSGLHMIPLPRAMSEQGELLPQQPKDLEEDCFNTCCAAGEVFVPRSLLGLVAKSYYVFGIVEALQNMTINSCQAACESESEIRPLQISLPDSLRGKDYGEIVEAFLRGNVGPHPAVCIGLLRETLYSETVMLHPHKAYRVPRGDLLIILASGQWAAWSQEAGLRCFGGRAKRTAVPKTLKRREEASDSGVSQEADVERRASVFS